MIDAVFCCVFKPMRGAALTIGLVAASVPAWAADFYLIPHSMTYNVESHQDEYIAYFIDAKQSTLSKCKAVYNLLSNSLAGGSCGEPIVIPFPSNSSGAVDISSTVIFTRSANHPKDAVFGPDGIWQLDQRSGKIQFCVFGDMTPKCVVLTVP